MKYNFGVYLFSTRKNKVVDFVIKEDLQNDYIGQNTRIARSQKEFH